MRHLAVVGGTAPACPLNLVNLGAELSSSLPHQSSLFLLCWSFALRTYSLSLKVAPLLFKLAPSLSQDRFFVLPDLILFKSETLIKSILFINPKLESLLFGGRKRRWHISRTHSHFFKHNNNNTLTLSLRSSRPLKVVALSCSRSLLRSAHPLLCSAQPLLCSKVVAFFRAIASHGPQPDASLRIKGFIHWTF